MFHCKQPEYCANRRTKYDLENKLHKLILLTTRLRFCTCLEGPAWFKATRGIQIDSNTFYTCFQTLRSLIVSPMKVVAAEDWSSIHQKAKLNVECFCNLILTVHLCGFSPVCRRICTTSMYWALNGLLSRWQPSHSHTNSFFCPWMCSPLTWATSSFWWKKKTHTRRSGNKEIAFLRFYVLSLSLSLSHTHTHTRARARTHACTSQ